MSPMPGEAMVLIHRAGPLRRAHTPAQLRAIIPIPPLSPGIVGLLLPGHLPGTRLPSARRRIPIEAKDQFHSGIPARAGSVKLDCGKVIKGRVETLLTSFK